MGAFRRDLDSGRVGDNHHPRQRRLDILPGELSLTSRPDAVGDRDARPLPRSLPPQSLYLLVMGLAIAYAAVLFVVHSLDRFEEGLGMEPAASRPEIVEVMVRDRWVWVAPMWAAASLLVVTVMERQSGAANVFMYRFF